MRRVKIGPSLAKLPLDFLLLLRASFGARREGGYDLVFSHEEAACLGVWLARRLAKTARLRHALQPAPAAPRISSSRRSPLLVSLFQAMEHFVLKKFRMPSSSSAGI